MNPLLVVSGLANIVLLVVLGLLWHVYSLANTNLELAHDTLNSSINSSHALGTSASKNKDKVIAAQVEVVHKQSEMLTKQINLTTSLEELIVKHTDCLPGPQRTSAQQLLDSIKAIQAKLPIP